MRQILGPMVYIQRTEHFCSAHKLENPKWDDAENLRIFGKCASPNYHGHNYVLTVVVKGDIDPETGFVMNFTDLKRILRTEIIDLVDHKNLNTDVAFMEGKITSAENLVVAFWDILAPLMQEHNAILHCIKLEETVNNVVEYYG